MQELHDFPGCVRVRSYIDGDALGSRRVATSDCRPRVTSRPKAPAIHDLIEELLVPPCEGTNHKKEAKSNSQSKGSTNQTQQDPTEFFVMAA